MAMRDYQRDSSAKLKVHSLYDQCFVFLSNFHYVIIHQNLMLAKGFVSLCNVYLRMYL